MTIIVCLNEIKGGFVIFAAQKKKHFLPKHYFQSFTLGRVLFKLGQPNQSPPSVADEYPISNDIINIIPFKIYK